MDDNALPGGTRGDDTIHLPAPQPSTARVLARRLLHEVAKTLGCLHHTRTSSEAFARRKQDEKAKEECRWKA